MSPLATSSMCLILFSYPLLLPPRLQCCVVLYRLLSATGPFKEPPSPRVHCCRCCWVASVMSDSVWPHRRQPTRLPGPWDSPGKDTGVGCHFLLQHMKVKSQSEVIPSCPTLSDPMDCSLPGCSIHGIFQARVLEWVAIAFSAPESTAKSKA